MRPDAALEIFEGTSLEVSATTGGSHSYASAEGGSEIRLLPTAGEAEIAHELLHAAFLRRGYSVAVIEPKAPEEIRTLRAAWEDAAIHAALYHELRARGFDDSEYWGQQMIARISVWAGAELTPDGGPNLFVNAMKLAETIACSAQDTKEMTKHCRENYPATLAIAERCLPLMDPLADIRGTRVNMLRLRDLVDDALIHANIRFNLRKRVGATFLFTQRQLHRPARQQLRIETHVAGANEKVISIADGSIGLITEEDTAELRSALDQPLADVLQRFGIYYTAE